MKIQFCLLNSILIAKTILDENPHIITTEQFDRLYLGEDKFDINDRVRFHTCIKSLIPIVKKQVREITGLENISIKVYKVDTGHYEEGANRMAGIFIKESEDKYVILLNANETYCTQRLSLCKELAEIFVGTIFKEKSATTPQNQVIEATKELVLKFYSNHYPTLFGEFLSTEMFAHSIALELMIPYKLRAEIKSNLDDGASIFDIAKRLFITEETLEGYMNQYFDITTPIYELIVE